MRHIHMNSFLRCVLKFPLTLDCTMSIVSIALFPRILNNFHGPIDRFHRTIHRFHGDHKHFQLSFVRSHGSLNSFQRHFVRSHDSLDHFFAQEPMDCFYGALTYFHEYINHFDGTLKRCHIHLGLSLVPLNQSFSRNPQSFSKNPR